MPTNPQADHALLLEHYKIPHHPFHDGSHSLQGISPLYTPLPGKAIKASLFYFTENSVSMPLFGTCEERLSLNKVTT